MGGGDLFFSGAIPRVKRDGKGGNEVVESCGAWNRHGKWSEGNHSGDACAAGCTFWKNAIPLSVLDTETTQPVKKSVVGKERVNDINMAPADWKSTEDTRIYFYYLVFREYLGSSWNEFIVACQISSITFPCCERMKGDATVLH